MRVLWGLFATSLLVGLSGAVAPGPLLTAVIGDVARTGFWTAPLLVLGHALLELVTVLALAQGLARAIRNPAVLRTIAALGGITLLVLGGDLARSAWIGAVHLDEVQTASAAALPILTGVIVSVSNPYWVLWWVTVGAGYTVAVLSNAGPDLRVNIDETLGRTIAWHDILCSAEVGLAKPDPAIYRLAMARLSLRPAQCFFIDDIRANVAGAQEVGWTAHRFKGDYAGLQADLRAHGYEW